MEKEIYNRAMKYQKQWNASQRLVSKLLNPPIPENIEVTEVRYGKEEREVIRCFVRKDLKQCEKPLLLYIHGGGWLSGETELRDSYVVEFAKSGFFAASVDYTLSPQAVYPTQIKQCFAAIDSLYDISGEQGIDMTNIVIAGESVGGHYITFVTQCAKDHSMYEKLEISFRHKEDFDIKVLVMHSGAVSIENFANADKPQSKVPHADIMLQGYFGMNGQELSRWLETEEGKAATPHITENFPPCFMVWAEKDGFRFETLDMIDEMRKLGIAHRTYKGTGLLANHAWSIMMRLRGSKRCFKETLDFVLPYLPKYNR